MVVSPPSAETSTTEARNLIVNATAISVDFNFASNEAFVQMQNNRLHIVLDGPNSRSRESRRWQDGTVNKQPAARQTGRPIRSPSTHGQLMLRSHVLPGGTLPKQMMKRFLSIAITEFADSHFNKAGPASPLSANNATRQN